MNLHILVAGFAVNVGGHGRSFWMVDSGTAQQGQGTGAFCALTYFARNGNDCNLSEVKQSENNGPNIPRQFPHHHASA
jgi:hypothetical protein